MGDVSRVREITYTVGIGEFIEMKNIRYDEMGKKTK